MLAWILSRISGKSVSRLLEEHIWQKIGAEQDGYMWLESNAVEMSGAGLNITARDAARFGQMILQGGFYNGAQVLPEAVTEKILQPGDPQAFANNDESSWLGKVARSYHDQWWTYANDHNAIAAIGLFGQFIYLDPLTETVIVKFSHKADSEGRSIESNRFDSPALFHAISEFLGARLQPESELEQEVEMSSDVVPKISVENDGEAVAETSPGEEQAQSDSPPAVADELGTPVEYLTPAEARTENSDAPIANDNQL